MPSLKTILLMDTEPYDAALVRSRAAAAVAGQDIQRKLVVNISAREESIAKMPAGAARMAAEEKLAADKIRLSVATQRAITGLEIAEYQRRGAAEVAWTKRTAYLKRKSEIMGPGGSGMAPGFSKLIATENAMAAAATVENLHAKIPGLNQVLRETMVLFRELGHGNWERLPSSFSRVTQGLAEMRNSLGPVGALFTLAGAAASAAVLTVVGAAVLLGRHLNDLAQRAKDLARMLDPLRIKFTEQSDAIRENAKSHQEYLDWLRQVGEQSDSAADAIDKVITKMRAEAQAAEELARAQGKTNSEILGMKKAELEAELLVLTVAKLQAQRQSEEAGIAAAAADAARQGFDPAKAKGAAHAAKNAGDILDAVQNTVEDAKIQVTPEHYGGAGMSLPATYRAAGENDKVTVEVAGRKITTTLAEAKAAYAKATALSDQLAGKEEELNKALADTKSTKEGKDKAVAKIKDDISGIQNQISIADKYGAKTAVLEDAHAAEGSRSRPGVGSLNSDQRIGAYSTAPAGLAKLVQNTDLIVKNTSHLNPPAHPISSHGRPQFGGHGH